MAKLLAAVLFVFCLACKPPEVESSAAVVSNIFEEHPNSLPQEWLVKVCSVGEAEDRHPFHSMAEWIILKSKIMPGDEIWTWNTEKWDSLNKDKEHLGLEGYCIRRSKNTIFVLTTFGNFHPGFKLSSPH